MLYLIILSVILNVITLSVCFSLIKNNKHSEITSQYIKCLEENLCYIVRNEKTLLAPATEILTKKGLKDVDALSYKMNLAKEIGKKLYLNRYKLSK